MLREGVFPKRFIPHFHISHHTTILVVVAVRSTLKKISLNGSSPPQSVYFIFNPSFTPSKEQKDFLHTYFNLCTKYCEYSVKKKPLTCQQSQWISLIESIYQLQLYALRTHLEAPIPPLTWLLLEHQCTTLAKHTSWPEVAVTWVPKESHKCHHNISEN